MLKKGDVVSVTFRSGYDKNGDAVMQTLDKCEVGTVTGSVVCVNYRLVVEDHVEIRQLTFDINSPEFVGVTLGRR
jgi:hypothetical protein